MNDVAPYTIDKLTETKDFAPGFASRSTRFVAPTVTRAFEAGDEGLKLLAFGPRVRGDVELVHGGAAVS